MPALIDPLLAALAAAIIGASGSAAAVPSTHPASCEQAAHTRATAANRSGADEVVKQIRTVVAEITDRARSGAPIDAPSVGEALDRANLPSAGPTGCTPWGDGAARPDTRTPRGTAVPANPTAADAAPAVATRIINALADAGFVTTPTAAAATAGHGDLTEPEATADDDGGANASDNNDGRPQPPTGRGRAGGAIPDAETVPLPGPAPLPRTGTDADPPTSRPHATTPGSSPPESAAVEVDQLLSELAAALSTTNDPGLQQLVEDLRAVLDGGVTEPGDTGLPGQLPTSLTDLLPESATALFHDDFESGDLAKWGTCQGAGINGDCAGLSAADGIGVVEDPERGRVAQFSVVDGKESEIGGERSEVRDSNNAGTLVKEGDARIYAWSMKFPADFPEPDGGWNILMQWHQSADSGSPPLALDISQGSLDIGGDGADAPRQTIGPIRRGEWVDYVLHVGFSQSDGFVEAWENGVQTVPRTIRQTMTDEASYLKMGIYRDEGSTGDAAVLFDDLTILGGDGRSAAPGVPPGDDTTGDSGDDGGEGGEGGGDAAAPGDDQTDSPSSRPPRLAPRAEPSAIPPAPSRAATPGHPPQPAGPPVMQT